MSEIRRERHALARLNRKAEKPAEQLPAPSATVRPARITGIILGGILLSMGMVFWAGSRTRPAVEICSVVQKDEGNHSLVSSEQPADSINKPHPSSFGELLRLDPKAIERFDIGRLNLLCAQGLPGVYADLEVELQTLDRWSEAVRLVTAQNMHRFREHPEQFRFSEGYFRMLVMVTVLQQDFHLDYNPARDSLVENAEPTGTFFADSAGLFIHGLLGKRLGTCSSIPVLYVAVGRQLGYPLKLVAARRHLFARWDEGKGRRFNIEATNRGLVCHDDDYYKKWPQPIDEADLASSEYLKSMTPAEETAAFLQIRGICLQVHGRYGEAKAAFDRAVELAPFSKLYAGLANQEILTSKK